MESFEDIQREKSAKKLEEQVRKAGILKNEEISGERTSECDAKDRHFQMVNDTWESLSEDEREEFLDENIKIERVREVVNQHWGLFMDMLRAENQADRESIKNAYLKEQEPELSDDEYEDLKENLLLLETTASNFSKG